MVDHVDTQNPHIFFLLVILAEKLLPVLNRRDSFRIYYTVCRSNVKVYLYVIFEIT
ncbi:hypothetical protein ES703_99395 [subsurface metagenome]